MATAFQNPRPWVLPCLSWGHPSPDPLPAWTQGCPQLATPLGIPPLIHPHSTAIPTPALAAAAAQTARMPWASPASPKPACARTRSVVLGQTRTPYGRGWGPGRRARFSGSRRMAPKQPLFSGLGAAAPRPLRLRGRVLRRRAGRGGAAGR